MGEQSRQKRTWYAGFTLIELIIVIAIVIIMSAVAIPSFRSVMSGQRLQAAAWQMVQDLRTAREDAILYQQDLNVYINFDIAKSIALNTVQPSNPVNVDNRSYLFETFQYGQDQVNQVPDQHYAPGGILAAHFTQRVLQNGIIITSIQSTALSSISPSSKKYFVMCFRSGSGSAFRGEGDVVTVSTQAIGLFIVGTNSSSKVIDGANLVITLQDPATGRTFNVIVKGTGEVSMGRS